jgi:hypothetical protein
MRNYSSDLQNLKGNRQPIKTEFVGENQEFQVVILPKGPSHFVFVLDAR